MKIYRENEYRAIKTRVSGDAGDAETCRKPVKRRDGRVYLPGRREENERGVVLPTFSRGKPSPSMRLRRFPPSAHLSFRSLSFSPPQPYLRIPNRLQTTATVLQAANYTTTLSCHVNVRAQDCWITPTVRNLPPENTALPFSKTKRSGFPRMN